MKKVARNLKRAFTIVELFIVMAVIAILAAVLIPTFTNVVSSAKENAAMQECHNALIDYLAQHYTEDTPEGLTFVNNGYAYVHMNGTLQSVGKLEKLARVNKDGELKNGKNIPAGIDVSEGALTNGEIWVTVTSGDDSELMKITLTDEDLYFYSVKTEKKEKEYVGFFTLETGSDPEDATYHIQDTFYSHQSFATVSEGVSMKVSANHKHIPGDWELGVGGYSHVKNCIACGEMVREHTPSCPEGEAKDNGDGTHTGTCNQDGCNLTFTERHTDEDSCELCPWTKDSD